MLSERIPTPPSDQGGKNRGGGSEKSRVLDRRARLRCGVLLRVFSGYFRSTGEHVTVPLIPPDYSEKGASDGQIRPRNPAPSSPLALSFPGSVPAPPADLEPESKATGSRSSGSLPPDSFAPEKRRSSGNFAGISPMPTGSPRTSRGFGRKLADLGGGEPKEPRQAEAALARTLRAHSLQTERIGGISTQLRLTQMRPLRRVPTRPVRRRGTGPYPKPWRTGGARRQ